MYNSKKFNFFSIIFFCFKEKKSFFYCALFIYFKRNRVDQEKGKKVNKREICTRKETKNF